MTAPGSDQLALLALTPEELEFLAAAGRCGMCPHSQAFHYTDDFATAGYSWCRVCRGGSCDDPNADDDTGEDVVAGDSGRGGAHADTPSVPEDPRAARCAHQDSWFDRSVCPEPCGSMHDRCTACGEILGGCPHDS